MIYLLNTVGTGINNIHAEQHCLLHSNGMLTHNNYIILYNK